MYLQKVLPPKLNGLHAIAATLLIVAALIADSAACMLLSRVLSAGTATVLFWVLGGLIALWAMRQFILSYSYLLSGSALRVSHAYGRYERIIEQMYFSSVAAYGSLADLQKRYPGAKVQRCTRKDCPIDPFAVAYSGSGHIVLYELQPDEKIRRALIDAARKNRK